MALPEKQVAAIPTGPWSRQHTRAPGAPGPLRPRVQPSCRGAPGRALRRLPLRRGLSQHPAALMAQGGTPAWAEEDSQMDSS